MTIFAVSKVYKTTVTDSDGNQQAVEEVRCDCCAKLLKNVYVMTNGRSLGVECAKELCCAFPDTMRPKVLDYYKATVAPFRASADKGLEPSFMFTLAGKKFYDRGRWYQ